MRRQKGFSLIELLIVVAIILIIAAIAVANLLRARIAANEASAVGSLRTINSAQITYASNFPANGFATMLLELGPGPTGVCPLEPTTANACLIDNVLGASSPGGDAPGTANPKSGYTFYLTAPGAQPVSFYALNANPVSAQTGTRHFYSDTSGLIRYNSSAAAGLGDAPLQ